MSDADLAQLLAIQEKDIHIDQLRHRRDHLPAQQELDSLLKQAGELKLELGASVAERDQTSAAQSKIEAEVAEVDKRITEINNRLYGTNPPQAKDAQAMTQEVEHLKARKSEMEDDELVLMEKLDPQGEAVVELEARARDLAVDVEASQSKLKHEQSVIDDELSGETAARNDLTKNVDAALLQTYEGLRKKLGGIAIAKLDGDRCGGCHLTLPATERDRVRNAAPGEMVRCEECSRILVRS